MASSSARKSLNTGSPVRANASQSIRRGSSPLVYARCSRNSALPPRRRASRSPPAPDRARICRRRRSASSSRAKAGSRSAPRSCGAGRGRRCGRGRPPRRGARRSAGPARVFLGVERGLGVGDHRVAARRPLFCTSAVATTRSTRPRTPHSDGAREARGDEHGRLVGRRGAEGVDHREREERARRGDREPLESDFAVRQDALRPIGGDDPRRRRR